MKTHARIIAACAALALVPACGQDRGLAKRADAVLSDARTGGTPGFYFLPPIAPEPAAAQNLPGLAPVVEIVALTPATTVLATFSGEAVKESGSHYMVHWSTKDFVPQPGTTYRIRVLLDGAELGFADAQVARNGRELRLLASHETFGLGGQRTLPIKFRIGEMGEPDGDGDGVPDGDDVCPTVADADQLDTDGDGVGDACECMLVDCPPGDGCRVSSCDASTGACSLAAKPAGTACDDGNPCTDGDGCVEGECLAGPPAACASENVCLVGACDPEVGCVFTPVADETTCGVDAICIGGVCTR